MMSKNEHVLQEQSAKNIAELQAELVKNKEEMKVLSKHIQEQQKLINALRVKIDHYRGRKKINFSWRKVRLFYYLLPNKVKVFSKVLRWKIIQITSSLSLLPFRILRKICVMFLSCLKFFKYLGNVFERSLIFMCQKLDTKILGKNESFHHGLPSAFLDEIDRVSSMNRSDNVEFLTEYATKIYVQIQKKIQLRAVEVK